MKKVLKKRSTTSLASSKTTAMWCGVVWMRMMVTVTAHRHTACHHQLVKTGDVMIDVASDAMNVKNELDEMHVMTVRTRPKAVYCDHKQILARQ